MEKSNISSEIIFRRIKLFKQTDSDYLADSQTSLMKLFQEVEKSNFKISIIIELIFTKTY